MIELQNLDIGYPVNRTRKIIFRGLNASFNAGELIGLVGNNGVGKSTLIKTITGNLLPAAGNVLLNHKNINEYTAQQLAQVLSIVITERTAGFNLTVWDIVASGRTPYMNVFAKLSNTDEAIVNNSLKQMSIEHLKHNLMDELSDGQRQKAMIAKSLAQQTPIIVLDEPTAFLDYNSKHQLFETLKQLCEVQQKLVVVSSHDLDLMNKYVHKNLTLMEGNIAELKKT